MNDRKGGISHEGGFSMERHGLIPCVRSFKFLIANVTLTERGSWQISN